MALPIQGLPIQNLDDRSFEQLVDESRSIIAQWLPNHNPSDPVITLVELFAWYTEMAMYRVNQVTDRSRAAFLERVEVSNEDVIGEAMEKISLVYEGEGIEAAAARAAEKIYGGEPIEETLRNAVVDVFGGTENAKSEVIEHPFFKRLVKKIELRNGQSDISGRIREAVRELEARYTAVTSEDYERLVLDIMEELEKGLAGRVICLNNRDLDFSRPGISRPGHVSLFIIPSAGAATKYRSEDGKATEKLGQAVATYLKNRRVLTTRLHVYPFKEQENRGLHFYKPVRIEAWISLEYGVAEEEVVGRAKKRIKEFLDPLKGGPAGAGWPLGRPVHSSELYQIIEGTQGVDHVVRLALKGLEYEVGGKKDGKGWITANEHGSIELMEHQLVDLCGDDKDFKVKEAKINVVNLRDRQI